MAKCRKSQMAKINVMPFNQLEKKFREKVFKKYGMKRGNITKAVEDAIKDWIQKE